jgi:hypothetical protein
MASLISHNRRNRKPTCGISRHEFIIVKTANMLIIGKYNDVYADCTRIFINPSCRFEHAYDKPVMLHNGIYPCYCKDTNLFTLRQYSIFEIMEIIESPGALAKYIRISPDCGIIHRFIMFVIVENLRKSIRPVLFVYRISGIVTATIPDFKWSDYIYYMELIFTREFVADCVAIVTDTAAT